jgi:hypothetical protein
VITNADSGNDPARRSSVRALTFGALTDRVGKSISRWCSIAGLAFGVYIFHKSMELLGAG